MGRSIRVLSLSLTLALTAAKAFAAPGDLTILIHDSQRIGLYGSAANVIVGNPAVADVQMIDDHSVVVTAKGFGATHVVVLDSNGRTLYDHRVVVVAEHIEHMTLYAGTTPAQFSCSPRCEAEAVPEKDTGAGSGSDSGGGGGGAGGPAPKFSITTTLSVPAPTP